MNYIQTIGREKALEITKKRKGEVRVGEHASYLEKNQELQTALSASPCKFVLIGIPEDIGVRANFGRGGAHTAWKPTLESLLSIQSNTYFSGKELFVAGEIKLNDLMSESELLTNKTASDIEKLRKLTADVDERVYPVIQTIIASGKIPLIIGGGHNNAYGNIKGASKALDKKVNCVNCDAHADIRPLEGRHSGNGFSYAKSEGYLRNYAVTGIHENYLTETAEEMFLNDKTLQLVSYEDIFVREKLSYSEALTTSFSFCKAEDCGVELDLDAITNVPSSAKTSSGISPVQARQFVYRAARELNARWLHIAEGAPVLAHIKADNKTGKLISYLVTDFIKGINEKKQDQ